MTSEILIMTRSVIALAADSAVTINGKKTYNGVNKLFMLSNDPPMGIMTYNFAKILDIRIETIIKEISCKCPKDSTLDNLKDHFEEYLRGIIDKYPAEKPSLENTLKEFIQYVNEMDPSRVLEAIQTFNNNNEWENYLNELDKNDKDVYLEILSKLKEDYKDYFDRIPNILKKDMNTKELDNLKKFFIKGAFFINSNDTGVVIAGFEKENMFPSTIHFKIKYLYDNKIILKTIEREDMAKKHVFVCSFAQGDVIHTFLSSIDHNIRNQIINYFKNSYEESINILRHMIEDKENFNLDAESRNHFLKIISTAGDNINQLNKKIHKVYKYIRRKRGSIDPVVY